MTINPTNWVTYNGSPEQIAEIMGSQYGFIKRMAIGENPEHESNIIMPNKFTLAEIRDEIMEGANSYLICDRHPLADMIIRQAQTGQPVWIKFPRNRYVGDKTISEYVTTTPDWNIPGANYSFTPFQEEDSFTPFEVEK